MTSPNKLIRLDGVLDQVPFCRSNIYRLIDIGEFPKPIKIGTRASAWLQSDIDAWLADRIEMSKEGK